MRINEIGIFGNDNPAFDIGYLNNPSISRAILIRQIERMNCVATGCDKPLNSSPGQLRVDQEFQAGTDCSRRV